MNIREFALELAHPLSTARGRIDRREGFLVSLQYGPATGVGEATPLPGWTESLADCRGALEAAPDLAAAEDWGVVLAETDVPAARHALALALADAKARATDQPLYRSLADDDRMVPSVPVNATIGDAPPAETAAEAREAVTGGFDCLKVKVGARSVADDVDRLRAVRNEVGAGVELRADVNGAWTETQAGDALDGMVEAGLDLAYVEQPLPAGDLDEHARLRGRGPGIAVDETLTEHAVDVVLEADAADVLVLKPMVLGGPDLASIAAAQAREAGVTPVFSTTVDAVVARTAAVHLAATLTDRPACGLATAGRLATDLAADPAPVSDGSVRVPQASGLGVDPTVLDES
jgi:o-succinylbenzoate synthase